MTKLFFAVWIVFGLLRNSVLGQGALPIIDYCYLLKSRNAHHLIWHHNQRASEGTLMVEHSRDGWVWQSIKTISEGDLHQVSLPLAWYGRVRIRWTQGKDTTTLRVIHMQYPEQEAMVVSYDADICKILLYYQASRNTDLLLRMYNSAGEEIHTFFLPLVPNEILSFNFEIPALEKDIYLLRLIDALSREIISECRLEWKQTHSP